MFTETINRLKNLVKKKISADNINKFENDIIFLENVSTKFKAIGPPDDLDLEERDKWIDILIRLADNSINSEIELNIPFKESIVGVRKNGNIINLRFIKPRDSSSWNDTVLFNKRKVSLREFFELRVNTFEDIIELEKTVISLL
jgi:hypothetical protein